MFSINIPGVITGRFKKKGPALLPDLFGLFQEMWRRSRRIVTSGLFRTSDSSSPSSLNLSLNEEGDYSPDSIGILEGFAVRTPCPSVQIPEAIKPGSEEPDFIGLFQKRWRRSRRIVTSGLFRTSDSSSPGSLNLSLNEEGDYFPDCIGIREGFAVRTPCPSVQIPEAIKPGSEEPDFIGLFQKR